MLLKNTSPLIMQPAFFSLFLIAVHVSVPVDCKPRPRDVEALERPEQSSLNTGTRVDLRAGRTHLGTRRSRVKSIQRDFIVILPVRTQTSNFVSIFDLRRKRFVCMDLLGELYNSRQKDKEGCLFQRIWLDWANHDVFYSTSGGRLLKIEGVELNAPQQGSSELSSGLLQRFLAPLIKRQKRSDDVNPSDPLRTETHPSTSTKNHKEPDHGQPERDQAGAVSKETITSCDDPLRVLQSNGPVSPVKTNIADRAEQ